MPLSMSEDEEVIGASSVLMQCVSMQHSFLSSIAALYCRTDINKYIYKYIYMYRKIMLFVRLGGLAPARPIIYIAHTNIGTDTERKKGKGKRANHMIQF